MNEAEDARPAIRAATEKVPPALAKRLGEAAWEGTMAWMQSMRKGGNDEANGNQASRP